MRFCFHGVLAIAAFVVACGGEEPLTFQSDIKPIVDAKCAGCHFEGGIAPFALTSFEDMQAHGGVSKLTIAEGTMPPWQAADGCNDYIGNRSLTDEHKQTFIDWVDEGSLQGDPADTGEPLVVERSELTRVDLELPMAEAYTPKTGSDSSDDYRCFLIEWPEDSTKYVTGFRAVPGQESLVHHVIAFLAQPNEVAGYPDLDAADPGPGYECFGATGGPAMTWLGSWAPGSLGNDLPPGLGLEVKPGSMVILQVHYNTLAVTPGAPMPADQTKLQLRVEDEVEKVAVMQPWTDLTWLSGETMHIPANQDDVTHSFEADMGFLFGAESVELYGAGLHMHLLGKSARLSVSRYSGEDECLLQIDDYDFDWQDGYLLREPVVMLRGDQLRLECSWDNTAENQPVVAGERLIPQDVFWGEGTRDEMCLGIVLAVLNR